MGTKLTRAEIEKALKKDAEKQEQKEANKVIKKGND